MFNFLPSLQSEIVHELLTDFWLEFAMALIFSVIGALFDFLRKSTSDTSTGCLIAIIEIVFWAGVAASLILLIQHLIHEFFM